MKCIKPILLATAFFFMAGFQSLRSQTTLAAGDILFTGFNGIPSGGIAPDTFSFVLLTPISSGTVIYFTERGYQGGPWQASGSTEGTISWTSGSALAIGQEVEIGGLGANAARVNGTPNGSVAIVSGGNVTTGLSLSNAGDQVIAFQGAAGDPTNGSVTFIAGINWALSCGTTSDATWNGAGCTYGPQSSTMPPGLTGGTHAFLAGTAGSVPNNDHGRFNCAGAPYSSVVSLKAAILTKSNWVFSSGAGQVYDLAPGCTLYASCSNPSITAQPSNRSVCVSLNTTFSITASGASSYQWQVNTGSGFGNISNGGVYSGATTATLTITGATTGMNGYLYRCIAYSGACSTTSSQATLTISNPSITASSQTNISCYSGTTGAATLNAATGGVAPYSYNWTPGNPTGDGSTSVSGLMAGTWTCTVTDNISCQTSINITITQPASSPGSNNYSLPTSNQTVTRSVDNYNYSTNTCELITAVVASGASPVSGTVTNKVWIEGAVPTHAGIPYVQRHYEITPALNPTTATGTITLFFTQAEFTNFNNHAGSVLNLPTGPADAAGKSNLLIGKYSGTSGTGTGLPASYSGTTTVIDPDDANIVWNTTSTVWEVTFPVTGFSGFIVQTLAFTLPVSWQSFEAVQQGRNTLLSWTTASEENSREFLVQHSRNGSDWSTLATVAAAGTSSSARAYQYIHTAPLKGRNYYRIIQTDMDGRRGISAVKSVNYISAAGLQVLVNPAQEGKLQVLITDGPKSVQLYNVQGQLLLRQQLLPGSHSIDVSGLAAGQYILKAGGITEKIMIQ